MRILPLVLTAAAAATESLAAPPASLPADTRASMEKLIADGRESRAAFELVRDLTDAVGPRLAGSPGDVAAIAWALARMKALGFENVRAEKVVVPRWQRGTETGEITSPVRQPLALTALGGSVATPEGGLEAEVVEAGTLEELDALGEKAKGRIVFLWKTTRRAREGAGYGETVGIRTSGAARAAKLGALGVLIRSVGTDESRFPHTGAVRYADGTAKIPAAALATSDADLLHRLLAAGKAVRVRFALSCATLPDAESANVIGEVRGRERPDEVVLVGGHLDSWDLGRGAVDDGAGCAISLEAARAIGALARRPRRTVRVVLFANEENGLAGARAYAKEHATELPKHVGALEADSGSGAAFGFSWNAGPGAEAVIAEIAAVLAAAGAGEAVNRGDGGADVGQLRPGGVPLFGLRQDASLYFDVHHTANDVLERVDAKDLAQATSAAAALLYALADLPEALPRLAPAAPTPAPSPAPAAPAR